MIRSARAPWFAAALLLLACSDAPPVDAGMDAAMDAGPTDAGPVELVPPPSFRHAEFEDTLIDAADGFHATEGEWHQDYGDASFFGLAFYARHLERVTDSPRAGLRDDARTRVVGLVEGANLVTDDLNEVAMGALGLTEYIAATGDRTAEPALTALVRQMNDLARLLRYYLDGPAAAGFAQDLYGATSLSAFVAILDAQHALHIGGETRAEMIEAAEAVVQAVDRAAWREAGYYAKNRETEELYLYPNITMMAANARLFQLTGNRAYVERARAVYDAIQALREPQAPRAEGLPPAVRYRSPYLRDYMELSTDDVATLSAQNYLMLALLILFEATGEPAYVEEVDALLDGVSGELFDTVCQSWLEDFRPCDPVCGDGEACFLDTCEADRCGPAILHHWIDGRIALEEDGDMFCSGCNLQTLFILETRRALAPAPRFR